MDASEIPLDSAAHTHDGFFKAVFSQPEHAVAFFKSHLPAEVTALVEWPSLELLPGSFVKSSLQQAHSDLLFSVRMGERETLLYLLFEHQSTPDPAMPLRLLGYMSEIHLKHHKENKLPLRPVLPFVLHQGPDRWTASTAFEDLFELEGEAREALLPFLPKFSHALLDLTRFDPSAGEEDARVRAVLQLMKLAREKELLRFFRWLSRFSAKDLSENLLRLILLYAMHSDSDLDAEKIYHNLSSNPELEKSTMSVAEKLRAEGRVEGLTEGNWIGKIQTLEEFLEKAISSNEVLEAMTLAELEALHALLHREYEVRFKRG
ncbi:Rpn family recombination-promoting nuclease/putative transposase [Luteolibacter yonseiensis]|uniref:Rpn family recombination-promoting nuclease/putative transposase n=1 Tax=Luteolibacter yonseiensis TaxID=1144680 RepID=A0A934VB76_9BACT|nr:Rpn family recombination-promoting nuclease/putative transposase [Luteolibacter yonseiensis]MBK1815870.1 Rpn family recombination-promoting nuclease/putative transposase [Luteolibacter yonseiensis]